MKVVLYSKSHFVSLKTLHEMSGGVKYKMDSLVNELRRAIRGKTDFGNLLLKNLEKGYLEKESQKILWKQILKKSKNYELLFLHLNSSKEGFDTLVEAAEELGFELKIFANLFLTKEKIEAIALTISIKGKMLEVESKGRFLRHILEKEKKRISLIEAVQNSVTVVDIAADCPENEMVENLLKEINGR